MSAELDIDDVAATSPLAKRELDALRAELAAERALTDWCLKNEAAERGDFLFVRGSILERIPAGQTARDVIDRLIGEGGQ